MLLVRNLTVALVGNPNTGKTTLFNALSGLRQHVGNYPGVTVETKKGQMTHAGQTIDLIDLPGTYSLAPRSPDEMVAVDVILGRQSAEQRPDVVLAIVDASNLDRNLYLASQTMELGVPVVLALNMIDIALGQGIRINADQLSQALGVPVVPIQANKGKGLEQLKQALVTAAELQPPQGVPFPPAFEEEIENVREQIDPEMPMYLARRLVLDVGGYTEEQAKQRFGSSAGEILSKARDQLKQAGCGVPSVEARVRYQWIRNITKSCVQRPAERPKTWTDRIDRLVTHRFWGTLIFLLVMFLVFQSIFTWAKPVMQLITVAKEALAKLAGDSLPSGPFTSLLVDGCLEGVGSVLVFLPQIMILFGFIAILEDCGYMARAAFLMDKLMSRCGLSGKSFIPMLSSVACAVPGILATRVIENRRDRLATIVVAPLMTCSARLPLYALLIAAFLGTGYPFWVPGVALFGMYALGLVIAPLVAWCLKRTFLRGEAPAFVLELPLYKWPSPRTVARRMWDSSWAFLRRAGTLIFAAMVLVWALMYFPRTDEQGLAYDAQSEALEAKIKDLKDAKDTKDLEALETSLNELHGQWKRQSLLGRMGRSIEPALRPLGWDWRIGMAALASFPAREVVVGTLGIIFNQGKVEADEIREAVDLGQNPLAKALQEATWEDEPGRKLFTIPTALSLMVFFQLCCQCVSTLAVIRRETNSWRWPIFTFTYMTCLAYVGALLTYQIGSLFL